MASRGKMRLKRHDRSIERVISDNGRKMCDTILLEDDAEENVGNEATLPESCDKSSMVLAEETASESESEDDVTATANNTTIPIIQPIISGTIKAETSTTHEQETPVVAQEVEESEYQVEQWSTRTWDLPCFVGNFNNYLDNESKYSDENEVTPVRTSLIQSGDEIDAYSTFIANLYLSQVSDHNHNHDGEVNLNMPDGASYLPKPSEDTMATSDVLMTVTLKLVEHYSLECPAYFHCKVILESPGGGVISSYVHYLTLIQNGVLSSMAGSLNMKELSKMAPDDGLRITLNLCMYRPPVYWGLKSNEVTTIISFMKAGSIDKRNRKVALELAKKCEQYRLKGIVDCLTSLPVTNIIRRGTL